MKHRSRHAPALMVSLGFLAVGLMPDAHARRAWDLNEPGLTVDIDFDYDGSRNRTSAMHFGTFIQWGTNEHWASASLDTFSDLDSSWKLTRDSYATLELGKALWRDNGNRFYINTSVEIDAHSYLASTGWDLTPELAVVKGITPKWWVGCTVAGVFATRPDEGNRAGYGSLTLWTTWLCAFLPNESDSISLGVWAATNEVPDSDNALFISLEYEFDITDNLEATLGVGTDPYSPWERLGAYAIAGLRWRW